MRATIMNMHVIETTVPESGCINVTGLPFLPGTNVEVIVIERPAPATEPPKRRFPDRGMPHTYVDPTEPVALDDWEALK